MEPFAGARAPPPVSFLNQALPPPRSVYEAAVHPILEALLQMEDDSLFQVVTRLMDPTHVISASMGLDYDECEIFQMNPMGADQVHVDPRRAYIHSVEYDFRFTYYNGFYANEANPSKMYNQRAFEHPPDNKIGLRIALIEIDHAFDYTINAAGEYEVLAPPSLEDLLVRPNRTIDGNEQPWTSGPTSISSYRSPWRKSRDLANWSAVSNDSDPTTVATGAYEVTGLVFAQGTAAPSASGLFQRVDTRPSPYVYRVLWETWEERAPQRVPSRWPAFKMGGENFGPADGTAGVGDYAGTQVGSANVNGFVNYQGDDPGEEPGGYGNYNTRGSLVEERYRIHARGTIPLKRSYWWTGPTAVDPDAAFVNTRSLYWVFIPKGSCCRVANAQDQSDPADWSVFNYPTPEAQSVLVRQIGSIEDIKDQNRFGLVRQADAYVSRFETQQAQMGERRYDLGQQGDHYQRGDRG